MRLAVAVIEVSHNLCFCLCFYHTLFQLLHCTMGTTVLGDHNTFLGYRVVSPRILFAPWVVSPLFPFAPGRFARFINSALKTEIWKIPFNTIANIRKISLNNTHCLVEACFFLLFYLKDMLIKSVTLLTLVILIS